MEVSYEVDTAASTATATDDYTAPSGTVLTIAAAETSGTIEIATLTDTVLEPDETLVLKLTGVSTAGEADASTTASSATATIEDTGAVKVSVEAAEADEGDAVRFVVELSGEVSSDVEVSYATSDGTAGSTDYTAVSATTSDVHGGTDREDGDGGDDRGRSDRGGRDVHGESDGAGRGDAAGRRECGRGQGRGDWGRSWTMTR